jgi:hypothetical protein
MVSCFLLKCIDEKTKTIKLSFLTLRTSLKTAKAWSTSIAVLHSTTKLDAHATTNDDGSAIITNDDA